MDSPTTDMAQPAGTTWTAVADHDEINGALLGEMLAGRAAAVQLEESGISPTDKIRLKRKIRSGRRAHNELISRNAGLVHTIVNDVIPQTSAPSRDVEDLVQEAHIGLCNAVEYFDPSEGVPFHTFAATMIRYSVRAARTRMSHQMKVPPGADRVYRIAAGARNSLTTSLRREPTMAELKEAVTEHCMLWAYERIKDGSDTDMEHAAHAVLTRAGISAALNNFEALMLNAANVASLDFALGSDEDAATLADVLGAPDDHSSVFASAERMQYENMLDYLFGGLDDTLREVMIHRLGLASDKRWTLAHLSEEYGVSTGQITRATDRVMSRALSPVASYVYLYDGMSAQISEGTPSAAASRDASSSPMNAADMFRATSTV